MSEDHLVSAIREGFRRAGADEPERIASAKTYEAAQDILNGLSALREMPGSTFDYSMSVAGNGGLCIKTNIPAAVARGYGRTFGSGTVDVYVEPRGKIYAEHDGHFDSGSITMAGSEGVKRVSSRRKSKAAEKVLSFVAERAMKTGLVDPKAQEKPAVSKQPHPKF